MSILDLLKEIPITPILRERLISLEAENAAFKASNLELKTAVADLTLQLEQSEQQRRILKEQIEQKLTESHNSNPLGYCCDHCGSQKLKRTGNRPDPTFGRLGIKQSIFLCNICGKESAFTQNN